MGGQHIRQSADKLVSMVVQPLVISIAVGTASLAAIALREAWAKGWVGEGGMRNGVPVRLLSGLAGLAACLLVGSCHAHS